MAHGNNPDRPSAFLPGYKSSQSEHGPPDENALKDWSFSDFLIAHSTGQEFVFDKQERSKLTLN